MKVYRIILDKKRAGMRSGTAYINEEGAKIIWGAYERLYGTSHQSMEQREGRGGICWLSKIQYWKDRGQIPADFNWKDFEVEKPE